MSENNDNIFADKEEGNPYAAKLDQLLDEMNGRKRGSNRGGSGHQSRNSNKRILFIPLILGIVIFFAAIIISSIPYAARPASDIKVALVSLEGVYNYSNSDDLDDTYIKATFTITNNGKKGISNVVFLTNLESLEGISLYRENISFSCGFLEYIESGETKTISAKIFPYYQNTFSDNENYPLLWNSNVEQVNAVFEIQRCTYEDGKTLLYTASWYTRNGSLYFWILTLSFAAWIGWLVYCFMTRCPNCGRFTAMKPAGKQELGRREGSTVEKKAFTDKYGNKIRDSKGKEIYYEETVYGYRVNYKYYQKCKYCGHITTSQGTEFER